MDKSGHLHTPAALPPEEKHGTHLNRSLVGPQIPCGHFQKKEKSLSPTLTMRINVLAFRETHCLSHGHRRADVLDVPAALFMRTDVPAALVMRRDVPKFRRILIPSSSGQLSNAVLQL
jgi:hypothetical protein